MESVAKKECPNTQTEKTNTDRKEAEVRVKDGTYVLCKDQRLQVQMQICGYH